jgi:hypothetical protein
MTYIFYCSFNIIVLIFINNKLQNFVIFLKKYFNNALLRPNDFVSLRLQSGLDLSSIVAEVNTLLPQLANFIDQFNNIITQSGINVITDSSGNMSIDVPHNMPDLEAEKISKRIGIIDRLITSHGNSLNDLFQKGLSIENKLKANNPNYVSELKDHIAEFKKLNVSYKH